MEFLEKFGDDLRGKCGVVRSLQPAAFVPRAERLVILLMYQYTGPDSGAGLSDMSAFADINSDRNEQDSN